MNIPVFPLHTVLFPQGILPLRIFEPRYIDMISLCMKQGTGFGVCLIQQGSETESNAAISQIGTLGQITDFETLKDGLLGITVTGVQRFRLLNSRVDHAGLMHADIKLLEHESNVNIPAQYHTLVDILRQIIDRFKPELGDLVEDYDNAYWVACRLTELLPLDMIERQLILEMDQPYEQMQRLLRLVATLPASDQEDIPE